MLARSPPEDEITLNIEEHKQMTNFVLSPFSNSFKIFVGHVGNNVPTNTALARIAGYGFVGCKSQWSSLVVEDIISKEADLIDVAKKLMTNRCNMFSMARHRIPTPPKAVISRCDILPLNAFHARSTLQITLLKLM